MRKKEIYLCDGQIWNFLNVRNNILLKELGSIVGNNYMESLQSNISWKYTGWWKLPIWSNDFWNDCDKLVISILDKAMSQRLQLDPDLTLEKPKRMTHQHEAVHEQRQEFREATGVATGVATLKEGQSSCHTRMDSLGRKRPPSCHGRDIQNQSETCTRCVKGITL